MNGFWSPSEIAVPTGGSVAFVLGEGSHHWRRDDLSDACELPCVRTFGEPGSVGYHCAIHPSMTGTVRVGPVPAVSISSHASGALLSGLVTVAGSASHAAPIASVRVLLGSGAPIEATLAAQGEGVAWSAQVPSWRVPDGERALSARATAEDGSWSTTSILVMVENPTTLDMVLASAGAQPAALRTNAVSFTLRNDGNEDGGPTLVTAEYLHRGSWRAIGTTSVERLAPGETGTGSIVWAPTVPPVGAFDVRVTADPDHALPDPDRANNERFARAGWLSSAAPGIVLTEPV